MTTKDHLNRLWHVAKNIYEDLTYSFTQTETIAPHHLEGTYSADVTLQNSKTFATQVYVGSAKQAFSVMIDTFSGQLVLPDSSCITCESSNKFDTSTSTTYVPDNASKMSKSVYGNFYAIGNLGNDTVSADLGRQYSADDFKFMSAVSVSDLPSGVDGVLGLSRYQDFYYSSQNPGESFVVYLTN